MRQPLVEPGLEGTVIEGAPAAAEPEVPGTLTEGVRRTDLRIAIEASTARILSIAMTREPIDPDPEAA